MQWTRRSGPIGGSRLDKLLMVDIAALLRIYTIVHADALPQSGMYIKLIK